MDELASLFNAQAIHHVDQSARHYIRGLAGLRYAATAGKAYAANESVAYGKQTLPSGIRSRFVENINGVRVHMLEAGDQMAEWKMGEKLSLDAVEKLTATGFPRLTPDGTDNQSI